MAAKRPRKRPPIACAVQVQRGGVSVQIDRVPLDRVAEVAAYLLQQLEGYKRLHPELDRPQTVEHFGGYAPLDTDDDGTYARRQVGF